MQSALEALIERFGDSRPERPPVKGEAVLAVIMLDKRGTLVESPSVSISSFGWGVTAALEGELSDLAAWPAAEFELIRKIDARLRALCAVESEDTDAHLRPIDRRTILSVFEALVTELRLRNNFVEEPRFAIRSYEYFKNPNPPEPVLLNSFFLRDLSAARTLVSQQNAPTNLSRYLGRTKPAKCVNVLDDTAALEETIAPRRTPLARWPSQGHRSLVLLQQAAVNAAFSETEVGGILGINGPPGTGKSTLLRDVLAAVIAARAEAMAKFDDPKEAFIHSGEKLKAGNAWLHLYKLDPALRGFEMVVASSNNRAVENISAEVPALNAVASDAINLRYFKTVSDALHKTETWGLIAAVLGNRQKRARFREAFWWGADESFNSYLSAVGGGAQEIEVRDDQTGTIAHRLPKVVTAEKPPSTHELALQRWRSARHDFLETIKKARVWQNWLEHIRNVLAQMPMLRQTEAEAKRAVETAIAISTNALASLETARQEHKNTELTATAADKEVATHFVCRPGFFARLFFTAKARAWTARHRELVQKGELARETVRVVQLEEQRREIAVRDAAAAEQAAREAHQRINNEHRIAAEKLAEARSKFGVTLADEEFFAREHGQKHIGTPWFSPQAQRVRDDVFISAVSLHRAFIDAAAKPLRNNLGVFINTMAATPFSKASKEGLLPDLWASLFLVVPLISTTFASVNRMLGRLPVESLGWLLVDEAGQASPQSVVGALMRARRVVIVGDPAQVEPVVMLPDALTTAISLRFGVDPEQFGAPAASVQSLADAASSYKSEFTTRIGYRTVGAPLLVHRRCAEPMFGISNAVAYSGLMVLATPQRSSRIAKTLGPSRWFNIAGTGEDKWCPQEGEKVLKLLRQLADADVKPDLYIVTPFVIVADRLRQAIRTSGILEACRIEDSWSWTAEHVGTIHTVQGREAEAVLFVLGAPLPQQTGARTWAGARPNLLNVAVTRAQEAIYIIGNRDLWQSVGVFTQLANRLPID
jgi:hypothetical protein